MFGVSVIGFSDIDEAFFFVIDVKPEMGLGVTVLLVDAGGSWIERVWFEGRLLSGCHLRASDQ